MQNQTQCRICGNEQDNQIHTAYELFYGLKDSFDYLECGKCKCIQLLTLPDDFSTYYPPDYVSGAPIVECDFSKHDRTNEAKFIAWASEYYCKFLQGCGVTNLNYSFLDVGCGNAQQTRILGNMGFKKAVGIDDYLLPQHAYESENCRVFKGNFFDIDEPFDFITFFNSFEHMDDHRAVLEKVRQLLTDRGICHIKMPIATYAWHRYKINWFQLDAPRHLMLHSYQSLDMLLRQCGFTIRYFRTVSSNAQFLFSELYKKDIPFVTARAENAVSYFPKEELDHYTELSKKLDEKNQGDTIELYIQKGELPDA